MIRCVRCKWATVAVGLITLTASPCMATAAPSHGTSRSSAAITEAATRSARQSGAAPAILITTYKLTPKVQRTVRFTGYATYGFHTRSKRRIVSATARIVGAQAHAVKIATTVISRNHKHFTVKLVFPGEQGNPGKLVVRLGTVGA
jgi:hypothetical protein